MNSLARHLDPRLSLASAIGWLVFALSISLAVVASLWVGDILRTSQLEQRGRQLERIADRTAGHFNLNLGVRLQSVRASAGILAAELQQGNDATLRRAIEGLQRTYPEFEWIGVANLQGRMLAAIGTGPERGSAAERSWFSRALAAPASGLVQVGHNPAPPGTVDADATTRHVVDLIAPVTDYGAHKLGVIGAKLTGRWLRDLASSLGAEMQGVAGADSMLVDEEGSVLIGSPDFQGKRWDSTADSPGTPMPPTKGNAPPAADQWHASVERLPDGRRYLVARAKPAPSDTLHALGWRVLVIQPLRAAENPGYAMQAQIAAVLVALGLVAALLGFLLGHRLTRDLDATARSADFVREGSADSIAVPSGKSEAARLGRALNDLLASLQRERSALQTLNTELDQRVVARTREIERLAEQERYAAVVRERLKIARDLHDTLAHSMMAMLAEIRLLKRISATDPGALAEEIARAEEVAHQGLTEARAAITQMRFNPVRDAGLAAALGDFVKLFCERTGIAVDFTSDKIADTFSDERAETLFRIAEEALRNVERHARATRVAIHVRGTRDGRALTMTIVDNGVGFDTKAPYPGHYGLAGLREQAQLIGAVLAIDSAPEQGTTISVELALALGMDS
jgi:signal transduction histidine kinase